MAATINQSFISQFSDNIHLLLEQRGSQLRGIFPVEMAKGEKHFFERLGNFTASEVVGRLANTVIQDPSHSRRMATVRRYEASTSIDDIDRFKLLIDPTSDYAKKLANAHGKKFDAVLLGELVGTAATGADGSGSQPFDSNNQIAHGSTGLTVSKFNQALRILEANEVDMDTEELYLIVGARGIENLLGDSSNQLTSIDFQNSKVLADGKFPSFRGVNIVRSQKIPDETADTTFRAILCTRDALKVAMAHDIMVKVGERADLNFAHQISTYMMYGAVRMEEDRVVDILYQ